MNADSSSAQERIHSLPIFLLVLGALSVGCGLWFVISVPLRVAPSVLLLSIGIIMFIAAGISLRTSAARDATAQLKD